MNSSASTSFLCPKRGLEIVSASIQDGCSPLPCAFGLPGSGNPSVRTEHRMYCR